MSHIEFEDYSWQYIVQQTRPIAETMAQGAGEMQKVQEKVFAEFKLIIDELNKQINLIKSKLSYADSVKASCADKLAKTQNQFKPLWALPNRPSLSQSASQEERQKAFEKYQLELSRVEHENAICRRNNEEVEQRIKQLQQCSKDVDAAIAMLGNCLQKLQTCETKIKSEQKEYDSRIRTFTDSAYASVNNMVEWRRVAQDSCDCALNVLHCNDSGGGDGGLRLSFTIDPSGHYTVVADVGSGAVFSASTSESENSATVRKSADEYRTIIIKEKSSTKVFEQLSGYGDCNITVKIPASNLHVLGGQKFLDEMDSHCFILLRKDGGIIGNDGYITWEKKS